MQTYNEITSDSYFNHIKDHVMGIGPWKDTVVPPVDNYLQRATDLIAKAHALGLQVSPWPLKNIIQSLVCLAKDGYYNFCRITLT